MLAFLTILGLGVAAILLVQELDIENLQPRRAHGAKHLPMLGSMKTEFLTGVRAPR
jgi:hypothetical protein